MSQNTRRPGSRRQAREYALQALYAADLSEGASAPGLDALWEVVIQDEGLGDAHAPEADEMAFSQRIVDGVAAQREAIDGMIEQCSTNWRMRRMPVVDRNILRLAAFELMFCPDIPATVSINEAVELAKRFGGEDSRAFVNGIVDRVGRQAGRLPEGRRGRGD